MASISAALVTMHSCSWLLGDGDPCRWGHGACSGIQLVLQNCVRIVGRRCLVHWVSQIITFCLLKQAQSSELNIKSVQYIHILHNKWSGTSTWVLSKFNLPGTMRYKLAFPGLPTAKHTKRKFITLRRRVYGAHVTSKRWPGSDIILPSAENITQHALEPLIKLMSLRPCNNKTMHV